MKKKILSLILACLMITPAAVSCKKDDSDNETSSATKAPTESGGDYAYIDEYVDGLAEEYNFNGSTFTIIDSGSAFPEEYEETGILEDDALYYRYRDLEEKFGIKLDLQARDSEGTDFDSPGQMIADEVRRDVFANGSSFDLVCGSAVNCGKTLINNGVVRSILDMPGIDISRSWWIPNMDKQLGIGSDLFSITGKANSSHYYEPTLLVFSKKVMTDYGIKDDLYQIVRDGDWTIDKMFEVASAVPTNASTTCEGTYRYYTYHGPSGYSFYISAGFTVTQKDDDNNPYIEKALTGDQIDFIQKLSEVFGDSTQNFDNDVYSSINSSSSIHDEDRVLFTTGNLHHVSSIKDNGIEFGILPMPKLNSTQKDYYSFSDSTWTMAFYFPVTLENDEMSGVITEAMGALSEKYLEPAYYEKALQGRSTYDLESRDMLDIIYSSEVIDLADMYKWGKVTELINDSIVGKTDSIVSSYGSSAKVANNNIKSLIKTINKSKKD